jgi:hypothetical protein
MRGGAKRRRVRLLRPGLPARPSYDPRGGSRRAGLGGVAWTTLAHLDPLTHRWGWRGGVRQGAPHVPYYPGPQEGGWGRSEGGELESDRSP